MGRCDLSTKEWLQGEEGGDGGGGGNNIVEMIRWMLVRIKEVTGGLDVGLRSARFGVDRSS